MLALLLERMAQVRRRLSVRAGSASAWITLVLVFVVFVLVPMTYAGLTDIISDNLYLGALYRDLFIDRIGLAGWNLQPAPSFFPDAPIFFVLRALLGRSDLAIGAYSDVAITALAFITSDLARLAGVARWPSRFVGVAAAATYSLAALYEPMFVHAIHPSCHGASVLVGLGVLAMAARQLRSVRARLVLLSGITLLTAATAGFDPIFFMYAVAPIGAAVVFCVTFGFVRFFRGAYVLVALGLGCFLSRYGSRAIVAGGATIIKAQGVRDLTNLDLSWNALGDGAKMIGEWDWHPVVTPFIVGALVLTLFGTAAIATNAVQRWMVDGYRSTFSDTAAARALLAVAAWLSIVGCAVGTSFARGFVSKFEIRYIQPCYVVPFIAVPFFFALARTARARMFLAAVVGLVACAVFLHMRPPPPYKSPRSEPWDLSPPLVACVDKAAVQNNARFGYALYPVARKVAERSKQHVRLLSVRSSGDALIWIANRRWYALGLRTAHNFLVYMGGLQEEAIKKRYGPPAKVVQCDGQDLWIYKGSPNAPPLPSPDE